jgi:hypothetical protein
MSMIIYTLYTQGPKVVESHICQNRADMGHPSFAVRLTSPDYFIEELAGLMARNWARPNLPWMRFSLRQSW